VDWTNSDLNLKLPGEWSVVNCGDQTVHICLKKGGATAGAIEMTDVPSLGEEKTSSAEQIQAVLAGRIQTLYQDLTAQRAEECGPGYKVKTFPPKPVKVAGQSGLKFEIMGSSEGLVRESLIGYRTFRSGIESIIEARGIRPGGCPGAEPSAFAPDDLASFEPVLDRLAAGSRLPVPTKFSPAISPLPSPSSPPAAPSPSPRPAPKPTSTQTGSPGATATVTGTALAGPTCPVERIPPDPNCAPRPVPGALLKVTDASGHEVAQATTDSAGHFRFNLAPGSYHLAPQPVQGYMGTASPIDFQVQEMPIDLTVNYDTGIR